MKITRWFMPKASYADLHKAPVVRPATSDLDVTCVASEYQERYARGEFTGGTCAADESGDWRDLAIKQACERVLKGRP